MTPYRMHNILLQCVLELCDKKNSLPFQQLAMQISLTSRQILYVWI